MKDNVLIVLSKHDFSYSAIRDAGFAIDCPYKGNWIVPRVIREIWFRLNLPGKFVWYNKRLNGRSKLIIVYDALIIPDFIRWLHSNNLGSKVIYLYTNPVVNALDPSMLLDTWCEKWTSDSEDYKNSSSNLHLVSCGGYMRQWHVEKFPPEVDIFYVGRDKGRLGYLMQLKANFEQLGLKVDFYITAYHRQQRFSNPIYRPLLPYSKVLERLGKTRAILHITEGGQSGITFRIMEAMIHQVKLITDNPLVKDTIAYKPSNVFVLGEDELLDIPAFLDKPFEPYDDEIIESLYYDNYIKRLAENEQIPTGTKTECSQVKEWLARKMGDE